MRGQVVPLAGNTPHTIRNESDADALAAAGEPAMEAVLAIAARHGVELLGPVPATVVT